MIRAVNKILLAYINILANVNIMLIFKYNYIYIIH
jgi:hypothetical protein